ncbi:MAG: alpha-amylase family glycosyl hydrolase [Eubacteriales bacterium]|nr:alpha-amylase family glycosyl hydrolase [Eubacteriales bacterium]
MKNAKRLLCLLIALMTLMSVCAVGITASAATVDTTEVAAGPTAADDFTWDNATVYFLLTDRFNNGNKSNDNSYNRNDGLTNTVAAFQGGDFKGITQKINDGYFTDLGVNAIWVAGWFEQTHGYVVGGDGKSSFPHYAYHGYYGLDFTELDENFGTEAEFKEMIDTAHSNGIRIILDVVMNHPGYNSIYDMDEYGFGTLTSNAMDVYNNKKNNPNQTDYHGAIKYNDGVASDWAKWWGRDWLRAGMAGYDNNGGGDLTGAVAYLPDFKTENQASLGIPEILKTKWTREGTYNEKVNEIDATFKKYNLGNKTVTNYLVSWYAKWVEEYGIDGFRCDTAKHVERSCWNKLSKTCEQALENWRQANPGAPGADWDEEFWTTGENFGMGFDLGSDYYTAGDFDSMINFSFSADAKGGGCNGMKKAGNLNSTYANYASGLNNNPGKSVLTYISSHDTGMCRDDLYYQGSALLLMPGAVQIYYGDESNRQQVSCTIWDHVIRGYMNWSSMDNGVLQHWQKVGTFRNNHVAVGAGTHQNLSATSGTAFARTYNKNGVNDVVACVVGANKNSSITITLNNTFKDGATLKNTYTGDTAQVSGGKVTFNSGAQGTILVELADTQPTNPVTKPTTPVTEPTTAPTKPTTPATKPSTPVETEYVMLGDADLNDKVNVKDATAIQKSAASLITLNEKEAFAADVDGSEVVNVKDATAIQKFIASMNTGYKIGENVVYKQGTEPTDPVEPTKPVTQPTDPVEPPITDPVIPTNPSEPSGDYVYLQNDANWASPNCHYWNNSGDTTEWPGLPMESLGNNLYRISVPAGYDMVIFNNGSGDQTENLTLNRGQVYNNASKQWSSLGGDTPTLPTDPTEPVTPSGNYVYLKDSANWGTAYIHYWSDSAGSVWPGVQMESMGNNLYRFALDSQYTGIVFNNGGNGQQSQDQTPNYGQVYDNASQSWSSL